MNNPSKFRLSAPLDLRSVPSAPRAEILVSLNFRVPFQFRQRMKLAAASRGITMTELLCAALNDLLGD